MAATTPSTTPAGLPFEKDHGSTSRPGRGRPSIADTATETGEAPVEQLYDLEHDLGETKNVAAQQPERIKAMAARLQSIREAGRSRP